MGEATKRRGVIVATIVIIIIFLLILSSIFFGIASIGKVVLFIVIGLIIVAIIGIVIWAFWFLFIRKPKFDATYMNKRSLIRSAILSKPRSINDLYLSGDAKHSRVRVGKITGYCRIQVMKKLIKYDPKTKQPVFITNEQGKKDLDFDIEKEEQDVFVVKTVGFPMSLFTEEMVVRVRPEDHDDLVGDVTLQGFSLIEQSEYFYLNHEYLDVRKIDFTILKEAERGIFFESLKDTKEIIDKAVGLDSGHKKEIEKKNLVELPSNLQGLQQ